MARPACARAANQVSTGGDRTELAWRLQPVIILLERATFLHMDNFSGYVRSKFPRRMA